MVPELLELVSGAIDQQTLEKAQQVVAALQGDDAAYGQVGYQHHTNVGVYQNPYI